MKEQTGKFYINMKRLDPASHFTSGERDDLGTSSDLENIT